MNQSEIEMILGIPPERDELAVQFFKRDGGQWGELYRENNEYWIDLYTSHNTMRFHADDVIYCLTRARDVLVERLPG